MGTKHTHQFSVYLRPDIDERFSKFKAQYPTQSDSAFINAALEFYLNYAERGGRREPRAVHPGQRTQAPRLHKEAHGGRGTKYRGCRRKDPQKARDSARLHEEVRIRQAKPPIGEINLQNAGGEPRNMQFSVFCG